MIKANDPSRKSFVHDEKDSDFPIQNLPYGVARMDGQNEVVSIIGNQVIRLAKLQTMGVLQGEHSLYQNDFINDLIAQGKIFNREVRDQLSDALLDGSNLATKANEFLVPERDVEFSMPVRVGDYTDFYSSKEHATNVGSMFRDPENALLPNWLHLPVGYHGRASSIVVSGTDIHRPKGQTKPDPEKAPVFGPCKLLDFELEVAFVVGKDNPLGSSISTQEADDYIFGITLFNDWSARDIQKWEYVPLGPFLAKNFASTISPWVVSLDALEPFRKESPSQEPEVLPYLKQEGKNSFDIELFVDIESQKGGKVQACHSNFKNMYWTMAQQLAHHTVNGCNFRVGDMCASGTISGTDRSAFGSMLEITWRGTKPLTLDNGEERKFIADGDKVILSGYGQANGYRIGFGKCEGKIVPAT